MTPTELLETLESLGSIDKKVLRKIRNQVDDPSRTVKPGAILSYLVRKDQISEDDARMLLRGETPKVSVRGNTEDLMLNVADEPESNIATANQTRPDNGRHESPGHIEDAVEVVEVETAPPAEPEPDQPMDDPMAMPLGDDAVAGGVMDEFADSAMASGQSVIPTFAGKKSNKNQWNSRWPYIGFGILGFLLLTGSFLAITLSRVEPDAMFNEARTQFENGSWQAAIKAYDNYLENYPSHVSAKEAEARRLQCLLLDSYDSKLWDETLTRADLKLPEFAKDEEADIDLIRPDLAVILTGSLAKLSKNMLDEQDLSAMQANIKKARDYKKLIDDPYFVTGTARRLSSIKSNIESIENNLRTIEGFIQKEKDYSTALTTIADLGEEGKTDEAFRKFKDLTQKYGDLAAREELRTTMVGISKLEAGLVEPADISFTPETSLLPTPIEKTIVMGAVVGQREEGLLQDIVPTLVDGAVYGINAGSGEIQWRRFVGLAASVQPQLVDAESVLVSDAKNNQVMLLKVTSGELIWRSVIGERFYKPSLSPEKLIVTTASGKVIRIDPATGQLLAAGQLPQPANTHSFVSEQDPLVYQTGLYSNLYVLGTNDMMCKEVFYLGHFNGSIAVPPYIYNGYLVVLINGGDQCDMHVLKTNENGLELELVQVIRRITDGPVTRHLQRYGKNLLVVSDNGQMVILQYNQGDEVSPITRFATDSFENESGQPTFVATQGSDLWVCGMGANYYKVKRNLGKFELKVLRNGDDAFVAPCKKLDENLFHVRKRASSGMVSASLVNASTLEQIWRNDFGGELAGPVLESQGSLMTVSNQGDLFQIGNADEDSGFVSAKSKASTVVESLKFDDAIQIDAETYVSAAANGSKEFVLIDNGDAKLQTLSAPSNNPACLPIALDGSLIVANMNGQVAAVDPRTGGMSGEAFQPPITPARKVEWIRPVAISQQRIAIATKKNEATESVLYFLDVEKGRAIVAKGSLPSKGSFVGELAIAEGSVFAVERIENSDSIVKVDSGSGTEVGRLALSDMVVAGPWATEQGIVVQLDSDQLMLLDSDLNQKWIRKVSNERFACPPMTISGRLALILQTGKIIFLDDQNGQESDVINIGQPIVNAPLFSNGKVYFAGMDGTVHVLNSGSQ